MVTMTVLGAPSGVRPRIVARNILSVTRLDVVQSAKSAQVLRLLARRLRRCTRNDYVRDFLPILEAAVARHSLPI